MDSKMIELVLTKEQLIKILQQYLDEEVFLEPNERIVEDVYVSNGVFARKYDDNTRITGEFDFYKISIVAATGTEDFRQKLRK